MEHTVFLVILEWCCFLFKVSLLTLYKILSWVLDVAELWEIKWPEHTDNHY